MRQLDLLTAALRLSGWARPQRLPKDAPGAKSDITIVESTPSGDGAASNSGAMNKPSGTSGALAAPDKNGSAQPEPVPGAGAPTRARQPLRAARPRAAL